MSTVGQMSSRAARKQAAESRRREWRLRWLDIAKQANAGGSQIRECVVIVGNDAVNLIRKTPQLQSEIERALGEFVNVLAKAVVRAKAESLNPEIQ